MGGTPATDESNDLGIITLRLANQYPPSPGEFAPRTLWWLNPRGQIFVSILTEKQVGRGHHSLPVVAG